MAIASGLRGLIWVWSVAYMPFWAMLIFLFLLSALSSVLLHRLQDLGSTLFRVGVLAATLQTTWLAMSERRHLILLLVFALLASGVFLSEKIRKVLRLPYYDSRRKWWESYPKGIPGLSVELLSETGDNAKGRLSNFGLEGCFVFSVSEAIAFTPSSIRIQGDEKVLLEAEVEPLLRTRDGFGWGLRFSESALSGDWTKDLQDYLGFLKRSGYEVATI
ncbi:MAG: hypothetical protein ACXVB9_16975 [Bdellovibrionota bacterium]